MAKVVEVANSSGDPPGIDTVRCLPGDQVPIATARFLVHVDSPGLALDLAFGNWKVHVRICPCCRRLTGRIAI